MNIVLTGFMASGKTTVGKILANHLNMKFIDTDEMIEREYGKISDIFAKHGEAEFRRIETEIIKQTALLNNSVIATGGGAVLNTDNIRILNENGTIINLNPGRAVIEARLAQGDSTRPLSAGGLEALIARFDSRRKFYDMCDFQVNVTLQKSAEDVAQEIINLTERTV